MGVLWKYTQEGTVPDHADSISTQVTLIGDMVGALLAHSMLSTVDEEEHVLDFIVDNFFSFGSPIANVLLHQALVKDLGQSDQVTLVSKLFARSTIL